MKSFKKIAILGFLGLFLLSFLNVGTAIENSDIQVLSLASMEPWKEVGNNTRMNLTAGQRHQFKTQHGNQIRLQVNQSAELKINETETNPVGPLPNQTRAVNRYMQLELNCTCEMNATLFRNFTNNELSEMGDANTFRWAWFNTTRNQWQYAEQNWMEHTNNGVTVFCNTTHFSIWTILAPKPDGQWKEVGNNTRMNLTAGQRHQFKTQHGNQIRLQVNQSAELKINETETNPVGPLPNQTRAVNRYMQLELNCTCEMNATLFRNFTNEELAQFGNASTFRWAWFNTTRNQWQYAEQNWMEHTEEGATIYCNTTHFSIWTILASDIQSEVEGPIPGTPFQSHNGTGFGVKAGKRYQIQTQSGFKLELQLNNTAEVTIVEYNKAPKAMNQERHQIRTQTLSIELNISTEIEATFSYTFTNQIRSQLGIKNMEKLKFMFYNETTNSWEAAKNQWLDGDTLYCNTTHFSLWTIAEEEVVESNNTPGFTVIPTLLMVAMLPVLRKRR